MSRNARQSKILDIISNNEVEKQEELVELLRAAGIDATQATISRDIKELNLIKTLTSSNRYKYTAMRAVDGKMSGKLISLFKNTVISIVCANNLVVVKTMQNSAEAAANVVEQMNLNEIIGVIAGSNSLLVVTATSRDAIVVTDKLTALQV